MSFAPCPPSRTVLSYGTFDGLGPADVRHLAALSRMGHEVIIGCATDTYCAAIGQQPQMPYAARRALLESCRYVSRVIAQECASQMHTDIVNYNVDALAMGAEFTGLLDHLRDLTQVVYLDGALEQAPRSLPLAAVG